MLNFAVHLQRLFGVTVTASTSHKHYPVDGNTTPTFSTFSRLSDHVYPITLLCIPPSVRCRVSTPHQSVFNHRKDFQQTRSFGVTSLQRDNSDHTDNSSLNPLNRGSFSFYQVKSVLISASTIHMFRLWFKRSLEEHIRICFESHEGLLAGHGVSVEIFSRKNS